MVQLQPLGMGDDFVQFAVQHEQRRPNLGDAAYRIVVAAHDPPGHRQRQGHFRHIPDGGKGRQQGHTGRGMRYRQLDGDRRAQGMAEVYDAAGVYIGPPLQVIEGGAGVNVSPQLRRLTLTAAITPVVKNELVHAQQPPRPLQLPYAGADIAAVAVKPQPSLGFRPGATGGGGDEPAVQRQAVRGGQADVLVGQPGFVRGADHLGIREKHETFFGPSPQHKGDRRPMGKARRGPGFSADRAGAGKSRAW